MAWPRWRQAALAATLSGILVLLAFTGAPRPALAQDNGQQSAAAETEGGQGAGDDFDMRRLARYGDMLVVTVNTRLVVLANFGFPGLLGLADSVWRISRRRGAGYSAT